MRRFGMGVGISKAKLSEAMLEVLLQLPTGTKNLKEIIVGHLGLLGQMSSTRDIDQAWNQAKKKAAKLYPEKFILDSRNALIWYDSTTKILDKKTTCLWLKYLQKLIPTNIVKPKIKTYKDGSRFSADYGWSSNHNRNKT